jgi:hypothetical protein
MTEVDRVEGAAENGDGSSHAGDLPNARSARIFNRKGRKGRKGKPNTDMDNDSTLDFTKMAWHFLRPSRPWRSKVF